MLEPQKIKMVRSLKLILVGHTSRENIELSANVKAEMEKASFDSAKVERIKESIRNGNYPIDLEKIAEGFVDLEKLL